MLCVRNFGKLRRLMQIAFYSRRSSDSNADVYKIVGARNSVQDEESGNNPFEPSPNWELFTPPGFKFYLPGSVGLAWQNASTITFSDSSPITYFKGSQVPKGITFTQVMECVAQECPVLLKKGVQEMFPSSEGHDMQLTVITLSSKTFTDIEETTKHFVLAAHDMCNRLKYAGYWADFINPFSGRPYIGSFHSSTLYKTDERFRCGFKVLEKGSCKIISGHNVYKKFSGNIFTNAPPSSEMLTSILNEEE